jgi:hypothetical protein
LKRAPEHTHIMTSLAPALAVNGGSATAAVVAANATAIGGLAAGAALGALTEYECQRLEAAYFASATPAAEQKSRWRWLSAQSIRALVTAGGLSAAVVAALGLLGASAAVTACVASGGIALAVFGAAGLAYSGYRWWRKRKELAAAREAEELERRLLAELATLTPARAARLDAPTIERLQALNARPTEKLEEARERFEILFKASQALAQAAAQVAAPL